MLILILIDVQYSGLDHQITSPQVTFTWYKKSPPSKISNSPLPLGDFSPPLTTIWKTLNINDNIKAILTIYFDASSLYKVD